MKHRRAEIGRELLFGDVNPDTASGGDFNIEDRKVLSALFGNSHRRQSSIPVQGPRMLALAAELTSISHYC